MVKKPTAVDINIGLQLRNIRCWANVSQEKLAEQLGITFQQVQKYEAGINRVAGSRLYQIARIFGVPIGHFFAEPAVLPEGEKLPEQLDLSDPVVFETIKALATLPHDCRKLVRDMALALADKNKT